MAAADERILRMIEPDMQRLETAYRGHKVDQRIGDRKTLDSVLCAIGTPAEPSCDPMRKQIGYAPTESAALMRMDDDGGVADEEPERFDGMS